MNKQLSPENSLTNEQLCAIIGATDSLWVSGIIISGIDIQTNSHDAGARPSITIKAQLF